MHTAEQLDPGQFEVEITGGAGGTCCLFEEWADLDRFGLIVTEPFGSLGASLLVQAAIATFYSVRPQRKGGEPEYPEIYLFHLGGRWGDHSSFDFWPPRKEVFLLGSNPIELLEAINDRAITYLAFPVVPAGDSTTFSSGASTWADMNSAEYRIKRGFEYSPSGRLADPDLILRSSDPRVLENSFSSLDLAASIDTYLLSSERSDTDVLGAGVDDDISRWASLSGQRLEEVPAVIRTEKAAALSAATRVGLEEQFKVVPRRSLLERLAGLPFI